LKLTDGSRSKLLNEEFTPQQHCFFLDFYAIWDYSYIKGYICCIKEEKGGTMLEISSRKEKRAILIMVMMTILKCGSIKGLPRIKEKIYL